MRYLLFLISSFLLAQPAPPVNPPTGGGATIPSTTDIICGSGTGNGALCSPDLAPGNVATLGANTFTGNQTIGNTVAINPASGMTMFSPNLTTTGFFYNLNYGIPAGATEYQPRLYLGDNAATNSVNNGFLHLRTNDVTNPLRLGTYNSTAASQSWIAFDRAAGSITAPTAIGSGYHFGSIVAVGSDAAGEPINHGPEILMSSTEAWVPGSHGSDINFFAVANGTSSQVSALHLVGPRAIFGAGTDDGVNTVQVTGKLSIEGAGGTTPLLVKNNVAAGSSAFAVFGNLASGTGQVALQVGRTAATSGSAVLQAVLEGVGSATLALNPNGGNVGIGTVATWSPSSVDFASDGTTDFGGASTRPGNIRAKFHVEGGSLWIPSNLAMLGGTADGDVLMTNSSLNGFGCMQLAGTANTNPAICRSSTAVNIRLGDKSGDAPLGAATVTVSAVAPTVGAGQIGYGATVVAASNCGSLSGAAGCIVVNVAGTVRYVPYW